MALKAQDLLVTLKIAVRGWAAFSAIGSSLSLSTSEVHAATKRACASKLLVPDADTYRVNRRNLVEFVVHGVRYVFPAERGEETRGIPTAHAHPLLREHFADTDESPPVWPSAHGKTRGLAFQPLYASVPDAIASDDELYTMLALVDAIRSGRARERSIAADLFESFLRERRV